MAILFEGDAPLVSEIDHLTPGGTIEVGDEFNAILTLEDGTSTQTEQYIATGTSVQSVVEGMQAVLAGSTKSEFMKIIWTEDDTKIIGTARVAGKPFYLTETTTESGGGAQDAQTFSQVVSVANSGPNDWNTAANWKGGSKPTTNADVIFAGTNVSLKYGLNQSSLSLNSIRFAPSFQGEVGDSVQGYYLQVNWNGAATNLLVINNKNGRPIWIDGTGANVNIVGTSREVNAVRLAGTITNLRIMGNNVQGQISIKNGSALTNLYVAESPSAIVSVGTGVTALTLAEINSGLVEIGSAITTINTAGGFVRHTNGAVTNINIRTGVVEYNGNGTITTLIMYGGLMDLSKSDVETLTISNATMLGGILDQRNGMENVTYTNNIIVHQGSVLEASGNVISVA